MNMHVDSDKEGMLPPHNIEAEQQLLGALLNNNQLFHKISDLALAEAMFDPVHRDLFEVIAGRIENGALASPVTIKAGFQDHAGLRDIGGVGYIVRLQGASVSSSSIRDYGDLIMDAAAKRSLQDAMREAGALISDGGPSAAEIASELENAAGEIHANRAPRRLMHSFLSASVAAVTEINDAYQSKTSVGLPTGISELDRVMGGLFRGDSTVLAGRPSMGKTTIGHHIAISAAVAGSGVFFGSLEMTANDLAKRAISNLLARKGQRVAYSDARRGKLDEKSMRAIIETANQMQGLPLFTAERECRDVAMFKAAVKRAQMSMADTPNPLRLVVVDYVQLLNDRKARNPYENASRVSDMIKTLAMDLDLPVVALSQLNRGVEARTPPVPMMSDLRESGKLEEDADNVLLAYRPAYYLLKEIERGNPSDELRNDYEVLKHSLDIIIGKQRNGATRTVTTKCYVKHNFIGDLDSPEVAELGL